MISGGNGTGARIRLEKLGISEVFLNIENKMLKVEEFLNKHYLSWSETLYMGDDIPDLKPMQKSAMPCAPFDSAPEILQVARYISPFNGGKGMCAGCN